MKGNILFLSVLCYSFFSLGQTAQDLCQKARSYYSYGDYKKSLEMHEQAYKLDSTNVENIYYMGICHLRLLSNKQTLELFQQVEEKFKLNEKFFIEYDFYHDIFRSNHPFYNYGRAYHINHEFVTAQNYYQKFLIYLEAQPHSEKKYANAIKFINRQITMTQNGHFLMEDVTYAVDIENVGKPVNSAYDDIVPLIDKTESLLIFTSRRPHENPKENKLDLDYEYMEDIYISKKASDSSWTKPRLISKNINTDVHDAAVGLSPKGDHLFIYRNSPNNLTGDIYESYLRGDGWSKPELLQEEINTEKYRESSATISDDGNLLFFTSDRVEGGFGGIDIYVVRKKGDKWGTPELLDDHINTPYDEESPFLSHDGTTLYFSSKGHNSMGGYDIFRSDYNEETGQWSRAENLGYPINTASDDVYFVWSFDGKRAYFSSHHEDSYGEQDLYVMTVDTIASHFSENQCIAHSHFLSYQKITSNVLLRDYCIELDYRESIDPLGKTFLYQWVLEKDVVKEGLFIEHCFKALKNHTIALNLIDPITGAVFQDEFNFDLDLRSDTLSFISKGELLVGEEITFIPVFSTGRELNVHEIYWKLGNGKYSCDQNITTSYNEPGVYEVTLMAYVEDLGEIQKLQCIQTIEIKAAKEELK